jgi:peptidoglycan-associated lipoprotein
MEKWKTAKTVRHSSILLVIILALVFSGCCAKKKAPTTEATPERVAHTPVFKEKPEAPPVIEEEPLEDQARKVGALQNIYFDFDKFNLKPEAIQKLDKTAAWLSENPGVKIRIEGHCDERGTNEYNLALGDRRANTAKKYLVNIGIGADMLSTISYGEERPADPGHNETAWWKNRRDEFKVIEK